MTERNPPLRPARFLATRRQALALAAVGAPLAGAAMAAPRVARAADACLLTPQAEEGPYYFDPQLNRATVTEGRTGVPMALQLTVVDVNCWPLAGARVDIWHCDAQGQYSGYAGQGDNRGVDTRGQHFLRGTQFANRFGIASFATIYPGWYMGRTTHIHVKVFLDRSTVLTTQVFLPDALNAFIYGQVDAYRRTAERDTLNVTDSIALAAGDVAGAAVTEERHRYRVAVTLGVDPAARPRPEANNRPPPPDGKGPPPDGGPPDGPPPGIRRLSEAERLRALIPGPGRPIGS